MSASLLAAASREQMSYTVDALKTHLPEAVELLCDSALNPKLANHEVANMAKDLKKEIEDLKMNPQAMLMEAVHATAYDGGLGNPLLASQESIEAIDGDALREFVAENYVSAENGLGGFGSGSPRVSFHRKSNVETVSKGSATTTSKEIPSMYMGGDFRMKNESPLTSLILGFEFQGGWRDGVPHDGFYPCCLEVADPSPRVVQVKECTLDCTRVYSIDMVGLKTARRFTRFTTIPASLGFLP